MLALPSPDRAGRRRLILFGATKGQIRLIDLALSRWLKRATAQGILCCSGVGYRGDPFLYGLPGRESLLWPGDHASEAEKQAWRDRCPQGSPRESRRLRG
jgi:hypothetical protein